MRDFVNSPESVMSFSDMMAQDWPGIELSFDAVGPRKYADSRAEGLWKVWCAALHWALPPHPAPPSGGIWTVDGAQPEGAGRGAALLADAGAGAAPEDSRSIIARKVMASVLCAQPGLLQQVLAGDTEAADALAVRMLENMGFTDTHDDVLFERAKQRAKGYDARNDDHWTLGQLITGARCYIETAFIQTNTAQPIPTCFKHKDWPWAKETFKPEQDRKANLIKAVAMLVAEVERIEREEARAR